MERRSALMESLQSNSGDFRAPDPLPGWRARWILAACAVLARAAVMSVWPERAFSCDLKDWRIIAGAMIVGLNPYDQHYGPLLNWPPMWLEVLYFLGKFSDRFDVSFFGCVRVLLTGCDAILVLSTFALLRLLKGKHDFFWVIFWGICVNPYLILLTIQQGNFDVIPTIGIVWFIYFLIRFQRNGEAVDWLYSAGVLGLSVFAKTFPLVLLPLLAGSAQKLNWKVRWLGGALCFGPTILSLAPMYVLYSADIAHNVLFYRGVPGFVGVSGLLMFVGWFPAVSRYTPFFTGGLIVAMVFTTTALRRRPLGAESDVVLLASIILVGVFEFGTGYCPQYWMWSAPLLLVSYVYQPRVFRILAVITGVILVLSGTLGFAFDKDIGAFLDGAWTGFAGSKFNSWFNEQPRYKAAIYLPLSVSTLTLWVYSVWLVVRSWGGRRATGRELTGAIG